MNNSYKISTILISFQIHILCETSIKKEVWMSMKFLYRCTAKPTSDSAESFINK